MRRFSKHTVCLSRVTLTLSERLFGSLLEFPKMEFEGRRWVRLAPPQGSDRTMRRVLINVS